MNSSELNEAISWLRSAIFVTERALRMNACGDAGAQLETALVEKRELLHRLEMVCDTQPSIEGTFLPPRDSSTDGEIVHTQNPFV